MSQAEIAGGAVTPENELPSEGRRLRDFTLTSALGRTFQLSDYRGRANLVLIVGDDRPETAKLMSDAASHYSEIKNEDAEVLAILSTLQVAAEAKRSLSCPIQSWRMKKGEFIAALEQRTRKATSSGRCISPIALEKRLAYTAVRQDSHNRTLPTF